MIDQEFIPQRANFAEKICATSLTTIMRLALNPTSR